MAQKSDIIDMSLVLFWTSDKAYLVGETEEKWKAVWVPQSLVERGEAHTGEVNEIYLGDDGNTHRGQKRKVYEFSMPEWLAVDKGLV